LGAFKWRALGGTGAAGGACALEGVGAAGKAGPFLMRKSPLLALKTIRELPEPILPVTDLS
jgi:hypothetical protein